MRGRYAPSPTGELHLGNLRTALVAWLGARSSGSRFVMRVEDLDPPRVIPGAERRLLDDLAWLGLDWDEGPGEGGPFAPYRQSERSERYDAALARLAEGGWLYACECTRAQLRGLASAPHGPGAEGPPYPGTCRDKGLPLAAPRTSLRFRVPAGEVCFDDRLAGRACQDVAADVGDFAVRRADGLFAYQLAVVVDDAAMEIAEVVRGADLLLSTPRQILLQSALGLDRPGYAHVPLVLGPGGERLAKRDRAASVRGMRGAGCGPERIVGEVAHSLGLLDAPGEARPADLVAGFAWERVSREPWRLSPGVYARLGVGEG